MKTASVFNEDLILTQKTISLFVPDNCRVNSIVAEKLGEGSCKVSVGKEATPVCVKSISTPVTSEGKKGMSITLKLDDITCELPIEEDCTKEELSELLAHYINKHFSDKVHAHYDGSVLVVEGNTVETDFTMSLSTGSAFLEKKATLVKKTGAIKITNIPTDPGVLCLEYDGLFLNVMVTEKDIASDVATKLKEEFDKYNSSNYKTSVSASNLVLTPAEGKTLTAQYKMGYEDSTYFGKAVITPQQNWGVTSEYVNEVLLQDTFTDLNLGEHLVSNNYIHASKEKDIPIILHINFLKFK